MNIEEFSEQLFYVTDLNATIVFSLTMFATTLSITSNTEAATGDNL